VFLDSRISHTHSTFDFPFPLRKCPPPLACPPGGGRTCNHGTPRPNIPSCQLLNMAVRFSPHSRRSSLIPHPGIFKKQVGSTSVQWPGAHPRLLTLTSDRSRRSGRITAARMVSRPAESTLCASHPNPCASLAGPKGPAVPRAGVLHRQGTFARPSV
jgi:hypothetical protein